MALPATPPSNNRRDCGSMQSVRGIRAAAVGLFTSPSLAARASDDTTLSVKADPVCSSSSSSRCDTRPSKPPARCQRHRIRYRRSVCASSGMLRMFTRIMSGSVSNALAICMTSCSLWVRYPTWVSGRRSSHVALVSREAPALRKLRRGSCRHRTQTTASGSRAGDPSLRLWFTDRPGTKLMWPSISDVRKNSGIVSFPSVGRRVPLSSRSNVNFPEFRGPPRASTQPRGMTAESRCST
mmetsp:Transcript_33360/g.95561  ORF Transcript_33360/g.95561 Transcript_33360/m.95561 type:complete len:239 (-) Transcript_33360:3225-3941(-)